MSLLWQPLRPKFRYLKDRLETARQLATPMASCRTRVTSTGRGGPPRQWDCRMTYMYVSRRGAHSSN